MDGEREGWREYMFHGHAAEDLSDMLLAKHIESEGPQGCAMRARNCVDMDSTQELTQETSAEEEPAPTMIEVLGIRPVPVFAVNSPFRAKDTDTYCARCELSAASSTSLAFTSM